MKCNFGWKNYEYSSLEGENMKNLLWKFVILLIHGIFTIFNKYRCLMNTKT